jgi:hypothetical protein
MGTKMIKLKLFILGFLWTMGWATHFAATDAAVNAMNLGIAFAPLIVWFLWFMLFVWDD